MSNLIDLSIRFGSIKIVDRLFLSFGLDSLGLLFAVITLILWIAAGVYSIAYMKHAKHKARYYAFYIILGFVLVLMGMASNIFTFYLCYELMTLVSAPLVMHDQTSDAVKAGIKYMLYSFVGAYFVLFGLFTLNQSMESLEFAKAPMLNTTVLAGSDVRVMVAVFLVIVGFGVKAGMWPMHAWLPTAHPVAPSPASAVLSGMIVKAGMLGIMRLVFYMVGGAFIKGTWIQYAWIALTLITVLMGSMQAYREPLLKKRFAYSTVSNASYILFGLAMLNETAYEGAMYQFVAHAFAKCACFMIAGALIHATGFKKVSDYIGIGKKYPVLMWSFLFCTLSLVGIPPTGGFTAKWFLCLGALENSSYLGFVSWLGPVILLVSALLTAGYMLPMAMRGFMPGNDYEDKYPDCEKISPLMQVPIVVLTVLSVLVGIIPMIMK